MTTPWSEDGQFVETSYKIEVKSQRDSADTTVFLDEFKTKVFMKKDVTLTLTCRQAVNDPGQDLIKECEDTNTDFYIAFTKDYTQGAWSQYKVACESYDEGLEVSNLTDTSYSLALAPGATLIKLQEPQD
ncbi:hypothetical protein [Massilimicrobiota sp. An142]|uniref:hypothetical protein n=1 Tax=Massilimicrobiota sp. An142 TaxID=1965564 RepID=UPI001302DAE2|nr:hypothetical protein [Massilimicrobiota sp. An142]